MKYKVSKTKKGDILVQENTGFVASCVNGQWAPKILFDAYQMEEDLEPVRDPQEAKMLWEKAHKIIKLATA
jgi:hypothetical protein